jgi:phosphodiesterase/alkaline phosphatase D-like protein
MMKKQNNHEGDEKNKEIFYRLKTPAARLRDWIGKTQTRDMPRPTVKPIATDTSCSAVWNPDSHVSFDDWPESALETKVKSPPFATPDGS